MYIFSRTRSADPAHLMDAVAFAMDIAQHVTKVTGVNVAAWSAVYGAPIGSLSWTCRAESLAALAAMNEQMLADAEFVEKTQASNDLFAGPLEDAVIEVLHTTGDIAPGNYTSIITAQCAPGHVGEAMAWAVEAQEASTKITGFAGGVASPVYGVFGGVGWMTPLQTIEDVEAANQAFKDPELGKLIDGAGSLFVTGGTHSRLIRRLA